MSSVSVPVLSVEASSKTRWWAVGFTLFALLFITALAVCTNQRDDLWKEYIPPPEPGLFFSVTQLKIRFALARRRTFFFDFPYFNKSLSLFSTDANKVEILQLLLYAKTAATTDLAGPGIRFGQGSHATLSFSRSQWEDINKTYNVLSFGCYAYLGTLNQTSELSYSSSVSGCDGDFIMCYAQLENDLSTGEDTT